MQNKKQYNNIIQLDYIRVLLEMDSIEDALSNVDSLRERIANQLTVNQELKEITCL